MGWSCHCGLAWNKWRYEQEAAWTTWLVSIEQTRSLMQQTLQRYFGEVLSNTLLTKDGDLRGETRWVTLSFTDLASYSHHFGTHVAVCGHQVSQWYFTTMHDVIDAHGGQFPELHWGHHHGHLWCPENLKPQTAVQCAIGYERLGIIE